MKLGHNYYYTTDNTYPDKNSPKYEKNIKIDKSTVVNIIGYNKKDETTEVYTLEYIVDPSIIKNIENLLEESKNIITNSKEGTSDGNYKSGSKQEFQNIIDNVENFIKKDSLTYEEAKISYSDLNKALEKFKHSKVSTFNAHKAVQYYENQYGNNLRELGYVCVAKPNLQRDGNLRYYTVIVGPPDSCGWAFKVYENGNIVEILY